MHSVWVPVFRSLGWISRSGIAGSHGNSVFNCLGTESKTFCLWSFPRHFRNWEECQVLLWAHGQDAAHAVRYCGHTCRDGWVHLQFPFLQCSWVGGMRERERGVPRRQPPLLSILKSPHESPGLLLAWESYQKRVPLNPFKRPPNSLFGDSAGASFEWQQSFWVGSLNYFTTVLLPLPCSVSSGLGSDFCSPVS